MFNSRPRGRESMTVHVSSKTLFVRNLPYSTSDSDLEKVFGKYGTLKACFTVKERGATDRCRGFGYVTYETREEADQAKSTVKVVGSRPVDVTFAKRKPPRVKPKPKDVGVEGEGGDGLSVGGGECDGVRSDSDDDYEAVTARKKISQGTDTKKHRPKSQRAGAHYDTGRMVVLGNLQEGETEAGVRGMCEECGRVESVLYPVPDRDSPTAFVTYQTHREARAAVSALAGEGAVLLSKENKPVSQKSLKKSRLIVRNLSFKCSEEDVRGVFGRFGELVEVHIPRKPNGQMFGYAFVQFSLYFSAAKALAAVNMQEVKGRPVAVDWVVSKPKYEKSLKTESQSLDGGRGHGGHMTGSESDSAVKVTSSVETANHVEEKGDDVSVTSPEELEGDDVSVTSSEEGDDVSVTSPEELEGDDVSVTSSEGGSEEEESVAEDKGAWHDVSEGRTVFVRNLPLDVDGSEVKRSFSRFGHVRYCRVMEDGNTGLCTGSAFLQFKDRSGAQLCLDSCQGEGGVSIRGRRLTVDLALSKKEARKQSSSGRIEEREDKRNLYLAKEGVILPGSEAAGELSKVDMSRRIKAQEEKKAKLSNPYYFVSKTRLSVRNLPTSVDEQALRKMVLKACNTPGARVVQVKILRSTERVDSKGLGRSKGFAFVELSSHEAALAALRATNNNPALYGKNRRLFVEFAVEDSRALKLREKRQQRLWSSRGDGGAPGNHSGPAGRGEGEPAAASHYQGGGTEGSTGVLSKRQKWRLKWRSRRLKRREAKRGASPPPSEVDKPVTGNSRRSKKRGAPSVAKQPAAKRSKVEQASGPVKGSKVKHTPSSVVKRSKAGLDPPAKRSKVEQTPEPSARQRKRRTKVSQEEADFTKMVNRYRQKFKLQTFGD